MAFSYWRAVLVTLALVIVPAAIRLHNVLAPDREKPAQLSEDPKTSHILIVLGSGGHTAEMLAMLERAITEKDDKLRLDWKKFTHRTWVTGAGDDLSASRAKEFEAGAIGIALEDAKAEKAEDVDTGSSVIVAVPRAREIHQSAWTAPVSCLRCLMACCVVLLQLGQRGRDLPDIILCNGPATATVLVFASVLLRMFNIKGSNGRGKMRTVYVESFARVKKLSLSGRILSGFTDRFIVQWKSLESQGEYLGILV